MVLEKIKAILSNQFDVDADSITVDTDLVDDLGADSLDLVDMLMSLEDEFNIGEVPDEIAIKVKEAVLRGMGMIFIHSAHHSKPFKLLMGTTCNLGWRESDDKERLWVIDHNHPIMEGITDRYFELEGEETYMEPFGIPDPDKLLLVGWYNGGEVFRSGCLWHRENGKVFYFQPGHETYPTFYNENVQKIITNAVRWAKPVYRIPELVCPWMPRIEK